CYANIYYICIKLHIMNHLIHLAIADQKEEIEKTGIREFIPREVASDLDQETNLIRIITGIRRCGKSTLARLSLQNKKFAYVNFDDERLSSLAAEELNEVMTALHMLYGDFDTLFLDEIQNIEGWSLFLNRLQRMGLKLIVTGSNSKLLSKELASHLTGRFRNTELFPFSFREVLTYKKIDPSLATTRNQAMVSQALNAYLSNGGLPEILKGEDADRYATDLFFAIVNRDVLFRYNIRHKKTFKDIAVYLVSQYGRETSFNRIKKLFSLGSEHTAKNYLDYLEEAYIVATVSKFSFKKQETIRFRKVYVIVPAFIRALTPGFSPDSGFLYENLVFVELNRRKNKEKFEIFYYKAKVEVDFLLTRGKKIHQLVQVTTNLREGQTMKREINALLIVSAELGCDNLLIINESIDEFRIVSEKKIRFITLRTWLSDYTFT
ncbi:MAG: ATP-binding protein, partial [Deltaproteobacteria bacterium]